MKHLRNRRLSGFTLIELMIAVAVVAILVSLAYPSYTQYVVRANRSAAQSFMLDVAQRQELFFADKRTYANVLGTGGLGLAQPRETVGRYTFSVALEAGPPPGFSITATAIGPQASDGNLTLDSEGTKAPGEKWK